MRKYKILSITILIILGIFIFLTITERSRAGKALEKNLYKRYGEEFNISALYKRKSNSGIRYQAEYIYPKSYDETLKEYDSYYWGKGFVRVENLGLTLIAGDTYGGVFLNESANKFYLSKLKELFGENVLPILDVRGAYEYTDFQKEYLREEKTISGGIYIFGRVENDKDREWYRKQIYEFVQFMKQTGTFEYTAIAFNVLDERVLSKEFQENTKLQQELVDMGAKNKRINVEYFREERRRLMNELPKNLTPYIKMEDINKSEIGNSVKWSYYNNLLSLPLYSEKYIRANHLEDTRRISKYEKVEDVFFTYEEY